MAKKTRSIEEQIETSAKNELVAIGVHPYAKTENINPETKHALEIAPSKNGGAGNNFPNIKVFCKLSSKKITYAPFIIGDIFRIEKGKRPTKANMKPGNLNYIGAISTNNGIRQKISSEHIWQPNCITVNYNGSVGCSYYQEEPFHASDDVNVLYLKNKALNRNAALFFCTVLFNRSIQFNYTEKWNLERMTKSDKRESKHMKEIEFLYTFRLTIAWSNS